jgi:hypothetical protein
MGDIIPMGQPILVGHHSEGRDRRYRDRIGKTFDKAAEAHNKAEYYRQKANSAGTGGISGLDPDALDKLYEKLANMEAQQTLMKAINKAHTAYLKNPASLDAADLEEQTKTMIRNYVPEYSWVPHPIAPYEFQNLNGNIRRVKQRIAELERKAEQPSEPKEYERNGYKLLIDDNRIQFIFDGKPSDEIRTLLKSHGFKWSPTRTAWVRQETANGNYAAKQVVKGLDALSA